MWEKYSNPITISNLGVYIIDYWSIDNADNREDTKTFTFTIIEDIGYLFAIGNFTETITKYTGNFNFMMFIGFVDREFKFITIQDEYLLLEKGIIIREILITSKIILVKIAKLP